LLADPPGYNAIMLLRRTISIRVCSFVIVAVLAGCGVSHRPAARVVATQPTSKPVIAAKPMIDFSRGAAGFPIVGHLPLNSSENFVSELSAGYAARVQLPTTRPTVVVQGKFPTFDSLDINLSDGTIRSSYRPSSMKNVHKMEPVASVKSLTYVASPLHYDDASQNLKITASNVKLELLRGKGEKEVLVMTDATQGEAHFFVSLTDLSTIVRDVADDNAGKAVFFVRDTKLKMTSENPHSLESTVDVRGFWLLIPTAITLTGRIDVDQNFYAKLSHLSSKGSDVGGPLLAGFIDAALKKYEGKVMPLAAFPGNRLKMRDLRISVDDALHIDAEFGD
jgi:hypothetical protein